MQAIVDAIRATGASQPILLAGLAHANDLSGWLANMPSDPDGHLAASFHVYQPNACVTTSCWDSTVAPVAAVVPTTTLEFSEQDCSQTFDNNLMNWDDAHGIGYLGWGWFILTKHCQSLYLINDWSGTPAAPNGTALHDHLAALAASGQGIGVLSGGSGGGGGGATGGAGAAGSTTNAPTPGSGRTAGTRPRVSVRWFRLTGVALSLRLRASQPVRGRVSAATTTRFLITENGRHRWLRVTLVSHRFSLPAHAWRVITVALPAQARRLLARPGAVHADVSVTVTAAGRRARTVGRVVAAATHRR
jgi:hypothetical protein